MGGLRRQRKYKACDPFSKEQLKKGKGGNKKDDKDKKYDKPPKKSECDNHFEESKSLKIFKRQIELGQGRKKIKHMKKDIDVVKGKKKHRVKEALEKAGGKLPSETQKQYFHRLDDNIQKAVNDTMKDDKKLRTKRKEHLKSRDEKKKANTNKLEIEKSKDFSSLKDEVKFGEVAQAPPTMKFAPRRAPTNKPKTLHLSSMMEGSGKLKKRKEMSEAECEAHDTERQRAIDAYRMIKKRKELKNQTG